MNMLNNKMTKGALADLLLAGFLLLGVFVVCSRIPTGEVAESLSSIRILLMGFLVIGMFGSCSKDPQESGAVTGEQSGSTVRVAFDLSQEFMQSITVKADDAVDENLVTDVWVLQLTSSGAQAQSPQYINKVDAAGSDYRVTVDLRSVAGQVWFIANTHDASAFNGSFSLTKMQTIYRKVVSESDLTTKGSIPMQGIWKGTPGAGGVPDRVGLKRSLCRVTLNLSGQLPAGDTFILQTISVKQVPAALFYAHNDDQIAQYPYPDLVTGSLGTVDFVQSVNISYDQNPSAVQSFTWLLPENARGIGTATLPTEKTGDTGPSGQAKYTTYLELVGDYTPSGKATSRTSYMIYLGADNTTDYNLLRGHAYTVNTVIKGVNSSDNRIDLIDALDYTDNGCALFGLMPNPENGTELSVFANEALNNTGCPEHYHVPSRAELMIVYAYYNALPTANLYGSYVTADRGSNSTTIFSVNLDSRWGGQVSADTYGNYTKYTLRCVRDVPSSGSKRYPYVEYDSSSNNKIVVSRDADGGVRPEALGTGGTSDLVSPKFEVQDNISRTLYTYYAAQQSCPDGWRLPNQREGMLMTALNINGIMYLSYSASQESYWLYPGSLRIIMCGNTQYLGQMWTNGSTSYARCIKDVE